MLRNSVSVALASLLVVGVLLGQAGCALMEKKTPEPSAVEGVPETGGGGTSENGYALLFDLLGDEQNVSKLLLIKKERAELGTLIKEISRVCKAGHERMEQFHKADPRLEFKRQGLPVAEMAARKSIAKVRTKQLLTGGGKKFEVELLLTQNEALTYASHLAGTTALRDRQPERSAFLQKLATDLTALQERVVAMLGSHYAFPEK